MRIWDCHCHSNGKETAEQVLKGMDQAGIERVTLFSGYPGNLEGERGFSRQLLRERIDHVAAIQAADPSRIYGMVWAEPRCEGVVEEVERGINDKGLRGVKLIPDHYEPCDPVTHPLYRKLEELGKPIMFHSGILYGFGDSSRFCRPALYEPLLHFPKLRFSLAHISWPWVDECLAVYGRFNALSGGKPEKNQMWIDTCRGTPDAWREEAMRKAVPFVGMERLMFGVDTWAGNIGPSAPNHIRKDTALLREVLGLSAAHIETFFWGACESFFKA